MRKINGSRQSHLKLAIYLVLSVGFISAMAMSLKNKNLDSGKEVAVVSKDEKNNTIYLTNGIEKKDEPGNADKKREEESKQAFIEAYKVFMHPRCMNCHPAGDVPLQGDDSRLHPQGVKRGPDGKGLYALKCKNCHQDTHISGENMLPGHSGWHLPPANLKMVFEGKSPRQLAMHFKDPKFTGFKTLDKMLEHVEKEPLVTNSWTYGTPPPLSHEEFVEKVKEWIAKGAAIPDK
jgi:hypothetical protein